MAMGWSESERRCKKHPMNRQSPGVCSSCLRERLAQLSSSKTKPISPSSYSSSSYSSCSYSSSPSPSSSLTLHKRENKNQISSLIGKEGPLPFHAEKQKPLVRSTSLVASIKNRLRETGDGKKKKKKKGGFWSTLLRSTSKRRKEVPPPLLRSKTVENKVSIRWQIAG